MSSTTPTGPDAESFRADAKLIEDSLGKDREAQSRLIDRLKCIPRMLAAKNARMGHVLNDSELEDLAQETLLTVWRKRADYRGSSSLETWVFPFCYHHLMNRIRKKGSRPRIERLEAAQGVAAEDSDATTDFDFLYRALDELGPPDDEIVRLKQFERMTFDEIGNRLTMSPNTAKSRYYRGMERLRTILARHQRALD